LLYLLPYTTLFRSQPSLRWIFLGSLAHGIRKSNWFRILPASIIELTIEKRPAGRLPAQGHRFGRRPGAVEQPKLGGRRIPPRTWGSIAAELCVPFPSSLDLSQVAASRL